jgi:hypothetical protein
MSHAPTIMKVFWTLTILMAIIACDEQKSNPYARIPSLGTLYGPITAYCDMEFIDQGQIDIEGQYLPHVVNCENGGAGFEALKAQAVAARSYLYYKLNEYGSIGDSQSDQVYTCGRNPGPQHYAAVEATSGEVLTYQDAVIAAFYVAGAIPSPPMCIGTPNDSDQYNTERYVTYNEGLSGDDLIQSTIGWVDPANIYNRGCQSQNGASCLASTGMDYLEILQFYYGEDITVERSEGDCILPEELTGGEMMAGMPHSGEMMAGENEGVGGTSPETMAGVEMNPPINAGTDMQPSGGDSEPDSNNTETNVDDWTQAPSTTELCVLASQEIQYDVNQSCAWQGCDDQYSVSSIEQGVLLTCEEQSTCLSGWQLRSNINDYFAFYVSLPQSVTTSEYLSYQINLSNGSNLQNQINLSNTDEVLLGWAYVETDTVLEIVITNDCGLGEIGLAHLKVTPIDEEQVNLDSRVGIDLKPNPAPSQGASCSSIHSDHKNMNSHLIFILICLLGVFRSRELNQKYR